MRIIHKALAVPQKQSPSHPNNALIEGSIKRGRFLMISYILSTYGKFSKVNNFYQDLPHVDKYYAAYLKDVIKSCHVLGAAFISTLQTIFDMSCI